MKKLRIILFFTFSFSFFTSLCKGQYTDLLNFNDTNGSGPLGSLVAADWALFGITGDGGAYGGGLIFSMNKDGGGYQDMHDFINPNGGSAHDGNLLLIGNKLFGMIPYGGTDWEGVVFSINTDGSGYRVLLNFNDTNGWGPIGPLVISEGVLFGLTEFGGINQAGNIFKIDTNGKNYRDIYNFDGLNDAQPIVGLTLVGNKLYGAASAYGGPFGKSYIFSIDTNGSGFKTLSLYADSTSGTSGTLTYSSGVLYGIAAGPAFNSTSNIFSIDTDGSKFKILTWLNNTGSFSIIGGTLYGMSYVGTYGHGCIFSIDTNGSGYTDLYNFNGSNGNFPVGGLTISGNMMYGALGPNGRTNYGSIFSFKDTVGALEINTIEASIGSINLYPNPNNGSFTVSSHAVRQLADSASQTIEVYNMLGEKVYSSTLPETPKGALINISNQPNGIYLYRVLEENGLALGEIGEGKIIIQK